MKTGGLNALKVVLFVCIWANQSMLLLAEDRWSEAMKAFDKQDQEQTFAPGGVVFVGSSSIRLWDLKKSFDELQPTLINRGFGGSQLEDSIRHVELLVLRHNPRVVIIYAGDNDIAAGKSAEQVSNDFGRLVKLIHKPLPKTKIAFIAIKPSIARWKLSGSMKHANARIAKQCDSDELLHFIDIWKPMLGDDDRPRGELFLKDGLHLNDKGYELWTSLVNPVLELKK